MSLIQKFVDERFLAHRLRSSSAAGIATGVIALLLFQYRLMINDVWNWDLLAVGVTFVTTKVALMLWYSLTD